MKKTLTNIIASAILALVPMSLEAKADMILSPTSVSESYLLPYYIAQRNQGVGYTITDNIAVTNFTSSPLDVNITWTETYNQYQYPGQYTINLPQDITLAPGITDIPIIFTWQCNSGGARVNGDVNLSYAGIPEPSTLVLLAMAGLSGLGTYTLVRYKKLKEKGK